MNATQTSEESTMTQHAKFTAKAHTTGGLTSAAPSTGGRAESKFLSVYQ